MGNVITNASPKLTHWFYWQCLSKTFVSYILQNIWRFSLRTRARYAHVHTRAGSYIQLKEMLEQNINESLTKW